MPTNARVNVQKDNVTDALSSSVVVPTGEALTIASGGSLTAEAGSIVNIPASGITGLGTMATQNANAVAITGGSITGITDLAVADGGTGTSSLTGYVKGAGTTPLTASSTIPNTDITGLGTMSTQNASSVAITGGSITGITDLAVADGGTGASNAADARVNLGVSTTGTSILYGDGAGSFSNVTIGSGVSFTSGTLSATGTGGTVTTVSVTPANGVSGTVANPTTTPAISLSLGDITPTTVNSVTLSGSATPNLAVTGTSTISGTNTGDQTISITGDVTAAGSQNTLTSTVTKINGQALATLATGILKNTTTTGVPSIAVAADFPTLNQNTTGNAATATNVAVTGVTGLGTGVASFLQTPTSANLSSMVTDETGTGDLVFANSPVLITPHLDTPSVLTLTNATGLPLSTGVTGTLLVANGGTGVTTSTGTGSVVLSASPTLTGIPAAPTAAVGTNTTQIATTQYVQANRGDKYLTTSNSTNTIDNGNGKVFNCAIDLSYIPTQAVTIVYDINNHMHATVITYNILTGVMVVDVDSHTGSGTYSAWTINLGGLTAAGGALLSANNLSDVASVSTSRANLGVTATGQDTTYLYRANNLSDLSSVTTARTNLGLGTMATQNSSSVSISGGTVDNVTLVTPTISSITNVGTLTLPNQTDTLVGRATTDVLTNKTLTSPVMTTPSLGVASATSINKVAITAPATGATLTIVDGATLTASATATVSGTNTGDQTISITGDVTASGSTGVLTSTVTKVNGTSLAGLATGILKNTTGTGVPSIAVSGSDYAPATSGNSILYGNSAGGFSNVTIGSGVAFSGGTLSATGTGGTVTTVSVTTANGVSGTVANPTTTPAISLTLGDITPSSVTALNNTGGYQITAGQLTSGDRMGISGQASGSGTALVFFDNSGTVFRPSIFDASSHSFKIGGVATTSITSTGFQGAIGATTAATGAFTTVTATTPIAGASGGTGVNNGANTITIAGNVTHAGAFTQSFTATANTALTLPTTGTLSTLAGSEALSNKTITASPISGSTGAFTTLSASDYIRAASGSSKGVRLYNSAGDNWAALYVAGGAGTGVMTLASAYGPVLTLDDFGKGNFAAGLAVTGTGTFSGKVATGGTANTRNLNVGNASSAYTELAIRSSAASTVAGGTTIYFANATDDDEGWLNYDNAARTLTTRVAKTTVGTWSSTGLAVTGKTISTATTVSPATSGTTQGGPLRLAASNGTALDFGAYAASPYGQWIQAVDTTNLANTYPLILNPNGGNVGIGATSPASILHLKKDAAGNGVSTTFEISTGTKTNWRIGCQNNVDNGFEITPSTAAGGLTFSTPVASFTSTGLAVTGALSATGILTVGDATSISRIKQSCLGTVGNMAYTSYLVGTTQYGAIGLSGAMLGTTATDFAIFAETGKNVQIMANGSTTAVGTFSSTGLAVTGEVAPSTLRFNRSNGAAWDSNGIRFQIDGTTYSKIGINDSSNLRISSGLVVDGNVGIGTSSPSTRLHVNGDSTFNQSSGYVFSITGGSLSGSQQFRHWVGSGTNYYIINDANAGVYLTYGGSSWTSNSDERAKDIIESITDATSKVSSLRAVIGKYKTDSEGTRRSFLIAQDVQAVLPEAVDASNPENLGVQYTEVIPLLVASIKELTQRVAALESK